MLCQFAINSVKNKVKFCFIGTWWNKKSGVLNWCFLIESFVNFGFMLLKWLFGLNRDWVRPVVPFSGATKMTWGCWTKEGWPDCRIRAWRCSTSLVAFVKVFLSSEPHSLKETTTCKEMCSIESSQIFFVVHKMPQCPTGNPISGSHRVFTFWKIITNNNCSGEIDPWVCWPGKWRHMRHTRIMCDD